MATFGSVGSGLILANSINAHEASQDPNIEDPDIPQDSINPDCNHEFQGRQQPYNNVTAVAVKTLAFQRSLRQSMVWGTFVVVSYLTICTWYFHSYIEWSIRDSLFFVIYTITTVGFGTPHYGTATDNKFIPRDRSTLLFISFSTLLGIAFWFLFLQLATTYVIQTRLTMTSQDDDKAYIAKRGLEALESYSNSANSVIQGTNGANNGNNTSSFWGGASFETKADLQKYFRSYTGEKSDSIHYKMKFFLRRKVIDKVKDYIDRTNLQPLIIFLTAFCGSIGFLAITIMILEKWPFIKSLYFSVITLTTIGYGDVYPTTSAGIWFVIVYLPISNLFVSFYLISVTKFYITMHDRHIERTEKRMKVKHRLEDNEEEEGEVAGIDDDNVENHSDREHDETPGLAAIVSKAKPSTDSSRRNSLLSLLKTFSSRLEEDDSNCESDSMPSNPPEGVLLSKLRINIKAQSRLNHIIASDIVNCLSLSDNCEVFLNKDEFDRYCDHWLIPGVARDVFLIAAIRIIFMAGKRNIILIGKQVIDELDSVELNQVYAPVLLAMGVSDLFLFTWVNRTEELLLNNSTSNTFVKTESDETKSERGCEN